MNLIIGITGLHQDAEKNRQTIGAGKDAAAARLIDKHDFVRIGIADHLKRICKAVFDFSDTQLWGPSEERNKPDLRYPRGGKNGAQSRAQLEAFKQDLAKLQAVGPAEIGNSHDGIARLPVAKYHEKEVALQRDILEWEAMAYLTPRYALQQLGTEWGRNCFDLVWIEDALRTAKKLLNSAEGYRYTEQEGLTFSVGYSKPQGVVFSDVRFHNEFDAIKRADGKLIRVKRFSWVLFDRRSNASHQSETELLEYDDNKFDYVIDNCGDLQHLGLLVDRMVDTFKGKIAPYDESQADIPPALRVRAT